MYLFFQSIHSNNGIFVPFRVTYGKRQLFYGIFGSNGENRLHQIYTCFLSFFVKEMYC